MTSQGSGGVPTELDHIPVIGSCDVMVVGGGAAGIGAAVAAARAGARTALIERSPFLGGRATASMVLVLDDFTDNAQITVRGLALEFVERLRRLGGVFEPPDHVWRRSDGGRSLPDYEYWASWGFLYLYEPEPRPLTFAVSFDPEAFKRAAEDILADAGVRVTLFTNLVDVRRSGSRIRDVVVRRRDGLGRVECQYVIDASGDGDVMAAAGVAHRSGKYMVTLVHRFGGVDIDRWCGFERGHPDEAAALNRSVREIYGGSWGRWWLRTTLPGIVWVNAPHLLDYDALNSDDLTAATAEARRRIAAAHDFVRKKLPGWEGCFLVDTCAELGTRQSRLLDGMYVLTKDDVFRPRPFDDCIGMGRNYYMPYRSIVPRDVTNLLVAGRCFSCMPEAQKSAREIPPCMVLGQAAGEASALALEQGSSVQEIDVGELQHRLKRAGAYLG